MASFCALIGKPAPVFSYIGTTGVTQNGSASYSTSVGIGPAVPGRIVIVVVWSSGSTGVGPRYPTSGTIGGATGLGFDRVTNTNASQVIAYATVSTGTTATVVLNFNGAVILDFAINVFTITGADNSIPTDYASNFVVTGPETSLSVNVDIPDDGIVAAFSSDANVYGSWTGVTQIMQNDTNLQQMTAGSREGASGGETGASVSVSASRQLQAISWA